MSSADDLRAELALAKSRGAGTDEARIKKQLAALGALDPPKTAPEPERERASEQRAATSRAEEPPKGRTSPRSRQSNT
jgi:hypothetical protein